MNEYLYQKYCTETVDSQGRLAGIQFHVPERFNFAYDVVDVLGTEQPERRAMVWLSQDGEERVFTFADIMKE